MFNWGGSYYLHRDSFWNIPQAALQTSCTMTFIAVTDTRIY